MSVRSHGDLPRLLKTKSLSLKDRLFGGGDPMKQPPSGIKNLYAPVIPVRNEHPSRVVHVEMDLGPELTGRGAFSAELEGKGHERMGGRSEGEEKEQREEEPVKRET
jgi:hypothetical protein